MWNNQGVYRSGKNQFAVFLEITAILVWFGVMPFVGALSLFGL
jgi:hypothetical protein